MSTNVITVDAPPSVVWAVLSDPPTYEYWVVGNKEIRRHDGDWPEPGAVFHHKVGFGPLTITDKSISLEAEPLRRLVMQVRALPVGTGIVTFELEPSGTGTKVVMGEATESGPSTLSVNDDGTGIRFNFPGIGRFRPIGWDEWFRHFDAHALVFVYERDVRNRTLSSRYRMVPLATLKRVADLR